MRKWIGCVALLGAAACSHVGSEASSPTVAQVDGAQHIVITAQAGHLWWSHRAWTEPHDLWTLPSKGPVEKLAVLPEENGFLVTFEQDGTTYKGRFGKDLQRSTQ